MAATGVHNDSSRSHSVLLAEVACRAGPEALPATGRLFLGRMSVSESVCGCWAGGDAGRGWVFDPLLMSEKNTSR